MSVLRSKRGESGVQFLDTARELEIYTLKQCIKFPKRLTFFISSEIVRLSQSVLNRAKSANSVYPTNAHEAQIRRDHLTEANNALQSLISQIDIAYGCVQGASDNVWDEWMRLVAEEARLLAAVKASDKKRYSKLT